MELFKKLSRIDFLGSASQAALISTLLFALSLLGIWVNGLRWGLDFTGGVRTQLAFAHPVETEAVRKALQQAGFQEVEVQSYGSTRTLRATMVAPAVLKGEVQAQVATSLRRTLPSATLQGIEFVGPQAGREMVTKGATALAVALMGIMAYVSLRFELRFAMGAAAALIHDPVLILGIFAWFRMEFNLVALAAVLAVIGYSLNNIVVIFDRVRENFRRLPSQDTASIINQSINQTLSRTLMTSGATLAIVLSLWVLGGELLQGFAVALIIGILAGSYSSVYVASALAVRLGLERRHVIPAASD